MQLSTTFQAPSLHGGFLGFLSLVWILLSTEWFISYETRGSPSADVYAQGHWQPPSLQWHPSRCFPSTQWIPWADCFLGQQKWLIWGDSQGRRLFYAAASSLLGTVDSWNQSQWAHSDLSLVMNSKTAMLDIEAAMIDTILNDTFTLAFHWDPFLNQSIALPESMHSTTTTLMIHAGQWFYKNMDVAQAHWEWQQTLHRLFTTTLPTLLHHHPELTIYIHPLLPVLSSHLHPARYRLGLENGYREEANHHLHQAVWVFYAHFPQWKQRVVVSGVLEGMVLALSGLDQVEYTEDGVHYDERVYKEYMYWMVQQVCLPQWMKNASVPLEKKQKCMGSCGVGYPRMGWKQGLVMMGLIVWGMVGWLYQQGMLWRRNCGNCHCGLMVYISMDAPTEWQSPILLRGIPSPTISLHLAILGASTLLLYLADRSTLFMKHTKEWDPLWFGLWMGVVAVGGWMTRFTHKDGSFLNRYMTEEWKGWMQIVILVYHYCGASRVSGIYNLMRILVASYLFMTGYGHFIYFYKKKDFGLTRVLKVLLRLNLLTVVLAYGLNTTFQSYYFSPLVTVWFCLIYLIMRLHASWNTWNAFLLTKILTAGVLITGVLWLPDVFEWIVETGAALSGTQWDAKEWRFRFQLDRYIVLVGMLVAFGTVKAQGVVQGMSETVWWRVWVGAIVSSVVAMVGFVWFELSVDKFSYNVYQPYISVIPVLAFIVLRNCCLTARQTTSALFTFFGRISLETFIIQFHFWLAMDTRGLLVIFPESWFLNLVVVSGLFVYLSWVLARVTGELTDWLTGIQVEHLGRWVAGICLVMVVFNHLPA